MRNCELNFSLEEFLRKSENPAAAYNPADLSFLQKTITDKKL